MQDKGNVFPPFVWATCFPCCVASATSVHPSSLAWWPRLTPAGFAVRARGGCCDGNLRVLSREEIVQKKKIIIKKISFCEKSTSYDPPFSPSLSELNSHILTLSIYLYSHLFTFLFKIFVYKCVYKLKIISSCPVSKWHLQGQGVCGIEVSHCITRAYKEAAPNTV